LGKRGPVDLDDINFEKTPYNKWVAYVRSKSANAMFAIELNRRYASKGITANAVHPGGIMTGLQKDLKKEEMAALGWLDENGKIKEISNKQPDR
jgi:NAD(P)-dependent dehydrogenase (short-subunit alcohol dehydrogenase family)